MISASQGSYTRSQLLLDISQGARIASFAYASPPPALTLNADGTIAGWAAAVRRARGAPQILTPGLLAGTVPGGAAYAAGPGGAPDAPAAAARDGRVAGVSIGAAATLAARASGLLASRRLVVADLSGGAQGLSQLRELLAARAPGELLIAVQRTAEEAHGALLWGAIAGLAGGAGRALTSQSTNQRGLIVSVDLAPTILHQIGVGAVPAEMRGRQIEATGTLDGAAQRALMARLRVVGGRRLSALGFMLLAWLVLIAACAPWAPARARAIRVGALGVLWSPVAVLIPAAFAPSAGVEYATVALACMALGALSDLLIPWPRAIIAPAIVAVGAITIDALAHTQLLVRSLLGPNPILGARFYGIGNEIKSGLAVLVLAAVAGALYPAVRGRRGALAMLGAGLVLAVVEGSARIGAGVGGVILVSAGFAVAAATLAGGALTRRRTVIVVLSPVLALLGLAVLDLLTAHGAGHYTGSILHARSTGELRDVIVRRYRAAWGELHNHAMPFATAVALGCSAYAIRARRLLLAPVGGDPAWQAAFAGGLTAGVVGAFSEDSGPVLLVVAVFALGCVATYLWGGVVPAQAIRRSPGRRHGSRSRARRPRAARAR